MSSLDARVQRNLRRYSHLASLARDPQTSAVYDARHALASLYLARATKQALVCRLGASALRPMTWMSAIGYRHASEEAR